MKNNLNDKKLKNSIISIKPFVYTIPSISSVSIRFLVLLALQVAMLFFTKSFNAVFVVLAAFLGAAVTSVINYFLEKKELYNVMNILIQGLFIGLLLPENYPVLTVFFISFLTLFVSRCIVFKSVNTWLNVPAIAVIIAWLIGFRYFPNFDVSSDILNFKNISAYLIQNGNFKIYSFDTPVTNFINEKIFSLFSVSIPEGFVSLICDTGSAIPAFRFNLLTIISSIIIFSDNAFSGVIPTLFLITYLLLVKLFGSFFFGGIINQGDMILSLMTGGTLFCVTFLIQWYGTSLITFGGKVLLGLISGVFAFIIMGCGTSPIGMAYTVLITNICCMMLRVIEERKNENATAKLISKISITKGGQR